MFTTLPYVIKSASILLVVYLYYRLFLKKQTFFILNRFYLLGSLLIAVITPFIQIDLTFTPSIPNDHGGHYLSNLLEEVSVSGYSAGDNSSNRPMDYLPLFYYAGVCLFAGRYLCALCRLFILIKKQPGRWIKSLRIVQLNENQPCFSFFNTIFINNILHTKESRRKIFEHEKIHIRQLHSLDLFLTEIICIINWFNPLVWLFKNEIMKNHEYIADQQVVKKFHTGGYFELLIQQTLKGNFSFINCFACSNLKKRMMMMTKQKSKKYMVLNYIPVTTVILILFFGFTCNAILPAVDGSPGTPPFALASTSGLQTDSVKNDLFHFVLSKDAGSKVNTPDQKPVTDDEVFMVVEKMPKFPGNVMQWIGEHTQYPAEAIEAKIQGKVFVQFIIEKDGSVSDIKVNKSVAPSLDNAAIKVISEMPKWTPGRQRGKAVRVSYTLPINFVLSSSADSRTNTPDQKPVTDNDVFQVVEKMPEFPGNVTQWIGQHVQYPEEALKAKIQGKVFVQFIIEKDGSVSHFKVIRGVAPSLDNAAVKVISEMPEWTPGQQRGKAVRVSYTLPINFTLSK